MAVSNIVVQGFGSWSTVNHLPVLGFMPARLADSTPFYRPAGTIVADDLRGRAAPIADTLSGRPADVADELRRSVDEQVI